MKIFRVRRFSKCTQCTERPKSAHRALYELRIADTLRGSRVGALPRARRTSPAREPPGLPPYRPGVAAPKQKANLSKKPPSATRLR